MILNIVYDIFDSKGGRNMDNFMIGNNIKEFRKNASLTQQQLADTLGKTESTIRKYENGSIETPLSVLIEISKILSVEIWDLIGVDRETARQNKNTFDEFGNLYTDDEEYKEHEFQKEAYEQEEKDMVNYYYKTIVPVLKTLGYKSNYFVYNSEHSIIIEKAGKEREISYKDIKEAISDSFYLAEYLLNKHSSKVKKITKERVEALENSPDKKIDTYKESNPIIE